MQENIYVGSIIPGLTSPPPAAKAAGASHTHKWVPGTPCVLFDTLSRTGALRLSHNMPLLRYKDYPLCTDWGKA